MSSNAVLQSYHIQQHQIALFVPVTLSSSTHVHAPYWAKVWPAAIGLCYFLQDHLYYIHKKKVKEIAAGLGLPSIFTASHADQVYCSDIEPAAMQLVQQSVQYNQLTNVHCAVVNWNTYTDTIIPDTVLLSDVNYEPDQFDQLFSVISFYIKNNCTVILSSPQRLMAKPFIELVLPFCSTRDEVLVHENDSITAVSIFVLHL